MAQEGVLNTSRRHSPTWNSIFSRLREQQVSRGLQPTTSNTPHTRVPLTLQEGKGEEGCVSGLDCGTHTTAARAYPQASNIDC